MISLAVNGQVRQVDAEFEKPLLRVHLVDSGTSAVGGVGEPGPPPSSVFARRGLVLAGVDGRGRTRPLSPARHMWRKSSK